jgi:hypothetical protein
VPQQICTLQYVNGLTSTSLMYEKHHDYPTRLISAHFTATARLIPPRPAPTTRVNPPLLWSTSRLHSSPFLPTALPPPSLLAPPPTTRLSSLPPVPLRLAWPTHPCAVLDIPGRVTSYRPVSDSTAQPPSTPTTRPTSSRPASTAQPASVPNPSRHLNPGPLPSRPTTRPTSSHPVSTIRFQSSPIAPTGHFYDH